MLSTHFSLPHRPSERDLQLLDLLARQAADYLERRAADEQQKVLVAELQESEGRMRAIVNTAQNGIITIDDNGTIESLNPAAERIFGYNPEETVGRNVNMLMPEPFRGEHDIYLKNYFDTGQAKVLGIERELTALRRNGSTFPMELTVSEVAVAGRRMFVGVVHDITNRARNAERQAILMAELDHRVKNVLARVAMLAASTRKASTSTDKYVRSLSGRIHSMAAAHSMLSQSGWKNVELGALVRNQLAPYATGSNVRIKGENIILGAAETEAVAMVLHELVTNAAKYGSLSVPDGRVCITWERVNLGAGTKLLFEWRELGGPPVHPEAPSGYGTSLIRSLIPHELGGKVDLTFTPDGVSCKIEIP
jgi:PAS domain S-box-containing protein